MPRSHGLDRSDSFRTPVLTVYTILVYTGTRIEEDHAVKNITLSADDDLIEAARARARSEHTTLNEEFRRWLSEYARRTNRVEAAMAVIDRVQRYARTGGRHFTREEMNER